MLSGTVCPGVTGAEVRNASALPVVARRRSGRSPCTGAPAGTTGAALTAGAALAVALGTPTGVPTGADTVFPEACSTSPAVMRP